MSAHEHRLEQRDRPNNQGTVVEAAQGAPAALNSQHLLRGQKTVAIEHNGELYRLQSTRAGKLILTK